MTAFARKRIDEPPAEGDDTCVLVDRLGPRGSTRQEARRVLPLKDIARSDTLRRCLPEQRRCPTVVVVAPSAQGQMSEPRVAASHLWPKGHRRRGLRGIDRVHRFLIENLGGRKFRVPRMGIFMMGDCLEMREVT
jgi:uncharacterized protein YeaO (DUF488 family)